MDSSSPSYDDEDDDPPPQGGRFLFVIVAQFVCGVVLGWIIPPVLFQMQWRVGEPAQLPVFAVLIFTGAVLAYAYPKTWFLTGIGVFLGLIFGAEQTHSKFSIFYVVWFAPWTFLGGLIFANRKTK